MSDIYYIPIPAVEKTINDYHISKFWLHCGLKQMEGLKIVLRKTKAYFNSIKKTASFEWFMYYESTRFFLHLLSYQAHPNHYWIDYYRDMLKLFHHHGYLRHKKQVTIYNEFSTKMKLLIKMSFGKYKAHIRYCRVKDIINDFGITRYSEFRDRIKGRTLCLDDVSIQDPRLFEE